MTEARSTIRRWGSSHATVIPPDVLKEAGIKEGDEVILEIRKARDLEEYFGFLEGESLDAQAVKDRLREEDNE